MLVATQFHELVSSQCIGWVWPFFEGRACTAADGRVSSTVISKVSKGRTDFSWNHYGMAKTDLIPYQRIEDKRIDLSVLAASWESHVEIRWPPVQQLWRQLTADARIISSGSRRICDGHQCTVQSLTHTHTTWLITRSSSGLGPDPP